MGQLTSVLEANQRFAESFDKGDLEIPPARNIAVLTCIDARIDPARALGLDIGDAHVIRNAGGRATDDAVRSLLISSWLLGTREFLVIHHTDCGMAKFTDDAVAEIIAERSGEDVSDLDFFTFRDLDQSVQDDVDGVRSLSQIPADATSRATCTTSEPGRCGRWFSPSSRSRGTSRPVEPRRPGRRSPAGPPSVVVGSCSGGVGLRIGSSLSCQRDLVAGPADERGEDPQDEVVGWGVRDVPVAVGELDQTTREPDHAPGVDHERPGHLHEAPALQPSLAGLG
jgi:carbonic anhydrase